MDIRYKTVDWLKLYITRIIKSKTILIDTLPFDVSYKYEQLDTKISFLQRNVSLKAAVKMFSKIPFINWRDTV